MAIASTIITASALFAGDRYRIGEHNCYYCGALCDVTHKSADYVKPTFTNRDVAQYPRSDYVCQGCVMSLGDGWADMPMIDGSVKAFTTPRGMAPRMYSWLITSDRRLAFTKAHIATVREMLTDKSRLPKPPFAWVLSDSGQKQLIFRARVAWDKDSFPLLLEDQVIDVAPDLLKERLDLANAISSRIGKPVLSNPLTMSVYIAAHKAGVSVMAIKAWEKVQHEPLSQVAAWLACAKEK